MLATTEGKALRPRGQAGSADEAAAPRPIDGARPLRVALVAPVWFPVPPDGYGGIEWVVSLLADGLADAGHDVTLFASGDSQTRARLSAVFERAPSERIGQTFWELHHLVAALERCRDFDIVHDHTGLLGAALGGALAAPLVHTVHGPLTGEPGQLYRRVSRLVPHLGLISISLNQRRPHPDLPWIANVPNALDFGLYPDRPRPRRGEYLLFLGRMTPEKGCHRAIEVARELELPLKIAGKRREPAEQEYFERLVAPNLDGSIEYLGEVSNGEKIELLRGARATLFPIEWEEPFGLVMIESMACGTPVIATRRGAVPEVVADGVSGVVVEDHRRIAAALEVADGLDPVAIRRYAEERFAAERMVAGYLDAYRKAIASLGRSTRRVGGRVAAGV